MTALPKRKTQGIDHVEHLSIVAPAVRMVVIAAWVRDPKEGEEESTIGVEIHPVVAIRSETKAHYTRPARESDGQYPARPPSVGVEQLLDEGWTRGIQATEETPLIVVPDGIVGPNYVDGCTNAATIVVACPWPPEEDDARLARAIERVKSAALARVASKAASAG